MERRDRAEDPFEEEHIDVEDDWVPPEQFWPTQAADRESTVDAAHADDSIELTAVAAETSDVDLGIPETSELWPADDSSFEDVRIEPPAIALPSDPLAATMLQTAESFATSSSPIEPTAAPLKPPEAIAATPLPPAEPLTVPAPQPPARTSSATDEPSGYRPWVAEGGSEKPVVRPPTNIPVKTLPLAPPIPPLRYESPDATPPPPPRAQEPPATTARAEFAKPAEKKKEVQQPPQKPPERSASARPSGELRRDERMQPPEQRTARPPRQTTSSQLPESVEPLAAVKRSLSVLEKLLAMTASNGAATLYLAANARPTIRLHGEVHVLDGTGVLSRQDVETLLRSLMLAQNQEALQPGAEWSFDAPAVGRVRCMTFRDHRGLGAVFRIGPRRAIAAEHLGLSVEIQSLALERDGLVLVAGPRSSGKGAVIAGLLDLINRTRRSYVITVEREVNASPDRDGSFISQREARGGLEDIVAVARAALRENPDVLVLQELRSAPLVNLAFDAAASGQLVIAGFTAPSAGGAIDRIIKLYPRESARAVQLLLSQHLRAIVSQVLVPKAGGGRVAAREVLLNTAAVASALADGKAWEIPGAIEAGRRHGMVPFSDALAALVQSGAVAADEAYRHAPDRAGFLEALKRHGIDASAAVRQA